MVVSKLKGPSSPHFTRKIDAKAFTLDQKASLTALIGQCSFLDSHMEAVLPMISGSLPKRRKNQDFMHWVYYLSKEDWKDVAKALRVSTADQMVRTMLQKMLDVVLWRYGCINPTEGTKKLMASVIYFILEQFYDDQFDQSVPICPDHVLSVVKDTWKPQVVKRLKHVGDVPVDEYIIKLPFNPLDLLNDHPSVLEKNRHFGFAPCPLDMQRVAYIDRSFGCRGGAFAKGFLSLSPARNSTADLPTITMLKKRKSLPAIADGSDKSNVNCRLQRSTSSLNRSMLCLGMDDEEVEQSPGLAASQKDSPIDSSLVEGGPIDSSLVAYGPIDSSLVAAESRPIDSSLVAAASQDRTLDDMAKELSSSFGAIEAKKPSSEASASARKLRGNELLDALIVHQKESQFKRTEMRKQKATEAALASGVASGVASGDSKIEKRKQLARAAALASMDVVDTPPKKIAKVDETPLVSKKNEKRPKPTMGHEASRKNWQVRSGRRGPGQNLGFSYGEPGRKYATKDEAELAARKALRSFKAEISAEFD